MSDDQPSSRRQEFWDKTLSALVGGLIAGVFAIAGSYFAVTFQMSAQAKAQKAEEQRKVFATGALTQTGSKHHHDSRTRLGYMKADFCCEFALHWLTVAADAAG